MAHTNKINQVKPQIYILRTIGEKGDPINIIELKAYNFINK